MTYTYSKCQIYKYLINSKEREFIAAGNKRYLSTQHERDAHTGLDYRGARYYDSDVARFLSTDPWQAKYPGWSTYNYVMGNPISLIDPTGKGPDDPDEKRKKNPSKISASYFGINRSQIRGNINTYLNKDFGYIQPFASEQNYDPNNPDGYQSRFAPDEASAYFELKYSFANNNDNISYSVGAFRDHMKGGFKLPETESGKVHWGLGNSLGGLGAGVEFSTPSIKGFKLSFSSFIGVGPQLSRFQDANVTPSKWGARGIGIVGIFDFNLKTPELGGIFSASLSVRSNIHHSSYSDFRVDDSFGNHNFEGANFTAAGISPTIQLVFNLSKPQ